MTTIQEVPVTDIASEYAALPKQIKAATTLVVWRGTSPQNGAQIMLVVSGVKTKSQNDKTGVMAQASILLADMHPWEALETGADEAICGDCPLRLNNGSRICYVNVLFNNGSQYKSVTKKQVVATPRQLAILLAYRQRGIRFGSYGDPGMLPFELINEVMTISGVNHTGYTHQWVQPWFDVRHFQYAMASIDDENTVELLEELHGEDVRYYRLLSVINSNVNSGEIMCPSDSDKRKTSGPKIKGKFAREITCAECGLCAGSSKAAKSIAINEE